MTETGPLPQMASRERISEVLHSCDRVRALWLSGSFARDDADRLSDLDFVVVVDEGPLAEAASELEAVLSGSFEFVLSRSRGDDRHRLLNFVTDGWERFDLSVFTLAAIREAETGNRSLSGLRALFDKDDLDLLVEARPLPREKPGAQQVEFTLTEFVRVLGLLPVVLFRQDLVGAVSGAGLLRQHLITLLGYEPVDRPARGALNQTSLLTDAATEAVVGLPPLQAERTPVIDFHRACWTVFMEFGPRIAEQHGARWPAGLVAAARSRLSRELDVELG